MLRQEWLLLTFPRMLLYLSRGDFPLPLRRQTAMAELNMIDTMGYGIHDMFVSQAKRGFPLQDYDKVPDSVTLTIYGRIIDNLYSSMLLQRTNLSPNEIVLLYIIDEAFRCRGYATQCAAELLRFAFEDMQYDIVHSGCAKENIASFRVMEKAGMRHHEVYDDGGLGFYMDKEMFLKTKT